jgi:hypothetical protein
VAASQVEEEIAVLDLVEVFAIVPVVLVRIPVVEHIQEE